MARLIDRKHLAELTFGDADLAREVLQLFSGQGRRLLPGIADPERPGPERADLAHTLKGSALGVGAGLVAALSATIEDSLRATGAVPADALSALAQAVEATLVEIAAGP